MLGFILVYSFVMIGMVDHKAETYIKDTPSIILIDPDNTTAALIPSGMSNIIHPMFSVREVSTNASPVPKTETSPAFKMKESYQRGDLVIVNYFYVEAIVVEKLVGDKYLVMYKDHNHVLQQTCLHRDFLLSPAPGTVSPVSLLVD